MWHFEITMKSGNTVTVVKEHADKDKFFNDIQGFMGCMPSQEKAQRLVESITVRSADGSFVIIRLEDISCVDIYQGKEPVIKRYQKKPIDKGAECL
jgi:hypothetical protein